MAPKRPLGLGKSSKAKKAKKVAESKKQEIIAKVEVPEKAEEPKLTNELTVELSETVDPDDQLAQLLGLWKTWLSSDRDNELILNGIIHECDRLLRNCVENGGDEKIELTPDFYSIYALSLSHLAGFHTGENGDDDEEESEKAHDNGEQVRDFFENALERIENGLEKFPNNEVLLFAKSSILLDSIPLEHISQMDVDSTFKDFPNVKKLLDDALEVYKEAVKRAEEKKNLTLFNDENTFEILNTLDDLLDIIDNFGKQHLEGLDSDNEDEEGDEGQEDLDNVLEEVELSKDHPLYEIQQSDDYNAFWRDSVIEQLRLLDQNEKDKINAKLRKSISKKLGQSYLMEAEGPISIFTTLEYENDEDSSKELGGLTSKEAQKISQELVKTALKYLGDTWDDEDPKSWVDIAEAEIAYGNLFDLGSEKQEKWYKKAEKKLKKANNATHGQFQDILDSLLQKD